MMQMNAAKTSRLLAVENHPPVVRASQPVAIAATSMVRYQGHTQAKRMNGCTRDCREAGKMLLGGVILITRLKKRPNTPHIMPIASIYTEDDTKTVAQIPNATASPCHTGCLS